MSSVKYDVRVVVIDDHEMILESIIRLLSADPRINVVGTALNGADGINAVRDEAPDVLVIDYHLPDMDAPEAILLVKEFDPRVRIITLSGSDLPEAELASSRAGSSAWIRKTHAIHELIDAIILVASLDASVDVRTELEPTLDQLVVHYQPIARLDTGQILGFEALVRWQHPTKGLLLPTSFLPQVIESGFIEDLDRWVRDLAFRQLVKWQSRYAFSPPLWMSVNLPDNAVTSSTFMGSLAQSIAETGVTARDVMVEISEKVLLEDPDSTFEFLARLNAIGVRLALENFGSSFSPISYIHRVPIDCLKIDRSFTADLPDAMGTIWLIECIARFAGSMGMMCVIEGVERDDQVVAIRSLGLNLGQGSHISLPLSASDCDLLLTKALQRTTESSEREAAMSFRTESRLR